MDTFTHILIGILSYLLLPFPLKLNFLYYAGLLAILPDFDAFLAPLQRKTGWYFLSHRGGSHSFIISALISAICAWIFSSISGVSFIISWILGFLILSIHITLDLITTSKVPLFYPVFKREFRLVAERAINPFLMLFSFLAIIFYIIYCTIFLNNEKILFMASVLLNIYLIYFFYRIITKLWVQWRLPENSRFLPGFLPLVYYIYEVRKEGNKKKTVFIISKKIQFLNKKQKIMESYILKESNEMALYNKAKNTALEYRFFLKWKAKIPVIWHEKDKSVVMILLTESLSKNHCYFVKVTFDEAGQIINHSDGFDYYNQILGKNITSFKLRR
ncbi:MAG: metal-dependent hydrolase [Promethearchaeota archaeon]